MGRIGAVAVVSRERGVEKRASFEYKLMATSKTSTMQREIQQAADQGFGYKGQTVFETAFGGKEVVVIMERDLDAKPAQHEYKLLATSKTSTMQKELIEAGEAGFEFVGVGDDLASKFKQVRPSKQPHESDRLVVFQPGVLRRSLQKIFRKVDVFGSRHLLAVLVFAGRFSQTC